MVKQEKFTSYTFSVTAPAEGNEFYNLVLYVNKNQEVYQSFIIKYIPSDIWLSDTSKVYSGGAQIIKNDIFNSNDVLQSKSGTTSKSNFESNNCAIVYTYYKCDWGVEGHRESPRTPGCPAVEFYVYYQVIDVPCTTNGGTTGGDGTDPDSGGTTTGGGSDSGVVTVPNTIPYTSQFKSFESGTLNATERVYYNSNANIKNTIQNYLIQKYFSTESKLNSKSAIEFGSNLNLNFMQFNWGFNNLYSEELSGIKSFLVEDSYSEESKNFAKNMITQMALNPNIYTSITPFFIEEQIDGSQLDACSKSVFQKVKSTTNNDFAKVFAKLGADGTAYTTTMISAVAPSKAPGQTIPNSPYNYTIYISTNYEDKTKLFIAATMLHEIIHAYFFSIVADYNSKPNSNQNLYNLQSFPSLFQAFCDKKYPPAAETAPDIHHLEIANYYVNAIAETLAEFQPGLPKQVYEDLAWGGLAGTPVFNETYPIGNPNRQRILDRMGAEQSGHPIGEGTLNAQINYGQPCN